VVVVVLHHKVVLGSGIAVESLPGCCAVDMTVVCHPVDRLVAGHFGRLVVCHPVDRVVVDPGCCYNHELAIVGLVLSNYPVVGDLVGGRVADIVVDAIPVDSLVLGSILVDVSRDSEQYVDFFVVLEAFVVENCR
jgi:hypothetical protein